MIPTAAISLNEIKYNDFYLFILFKLNELCIHGVAFY